MLGQMQQDVLAKCLLALLPSAAGSNDAVQAVVRIPWEQQAHDLAAQPAEALLSRMLTCRCWQRPHMQLLEPRVPQC